MNPVRRIRRIRRRDDNVRVNNLIRRPISMDYTWSRIIRPNTVYDNIENSNQWNDDYNDERNDDIHNLKKSIISFNDHKLLTINNINDIEYMIDNNPNKLILLLKLNKISSVEVLSNFLVSITSNNMLYIYYNICKFDMNQYLDDNVHFLMKTPDLLYAIIFDKSNKSIKDTYILNNTENDNNYTLDTRYNYMNYIVLNIEHKNTIDIICGNFKILNNINDDIELSLIKFKNYSIISYYELINITPSMTVINNIINNNWIEGIKYILNNDYIKLSYLLYHMYSIKTNDKKYWNLLLDEYSNIIDISKIIKFDMCHIKYLFPEIYKNISIDLYIDIILKNLTKSFIGYILGFDIHIQTPSIEKCKIKFKDILNLGYKKYYDDLKEKTKEHIQNKYENILNDKNTLFENVYSYSTFDIICVQSELETKTNNEIELETKTNNEMTVETKTNNEIELETNNEMTVETKNRKKKIHTHIFTRSEFNSLIKSHGNNIMTNFYTREGIGKPSVGFIYQRIIYSDKYGLPNSIPLIELFETYLIPPVISTVQD